MSVFSFLQNEVQGAGNTIANGVSNTYHAAVNNIGPYVSKAVQNAVPGESYLAGAANMGWQGVKQLPQAYNAVRQGNFQQFAQNAAPAYRYTQNQVINPITQGIAGTQVAADLYGSAGRNAFSVAGAALPALQGAFNATPAGVVWNAKTGAFTTAAQALRGEPSKGLTKNITDPTDFFQQGLGGNSAEHPYISMAVNALAGNPEGSVTSLANLKNLKNVGELKNVIPNTKTLVKSGSQLLGFSGSKDGVVSDLNTLGNGAKKVIGKTLIGIDNSGKRLSTVVPRDVTQRGTFNQIANYHNAAPPKTITENIGGVPVTRPASAEDFQHAFITPEELKAHFKDGTPITKSDYSRGKIEATVDMNGKVVSWDTQDPKIRTQLDRNFDYTKYQGKVGKPADPNLNPSMEGAQARQTPEAAAMAANHPDVPLTTVLPKNTGTGSGAVTDGFSAHAKNSPDLSAEAKAQISLTDHTPRNTAELGAKYDQMAQSDPVATMQKALEGKSDESTAAAISMVKKFGAEGNYDQMAQMVDTHAKNALEAGRTVQANTLLASMSPEGRVAYAARKLQEKGLSITPEQTQQLHEQAQAVAALPEGRDKLLAQQKLNEAIGSMIPSTMGDKAFALYRTGLLTGFRTPGKILLSHALSNTTEAVKNIPASIIDQVISVGTGKRSLVATPKGIASGAWKGTMAAVDNLVHGFETPGSGGMQHDFANQVHFSNTWYGKAAQTYVDSISRLHGSLYKPFYGAQHMNSLFDMALTNARNEGLSGTAKESFVQDFIKKAADASPTVKSDAHAAFTTPEGAAARANAEAEYTTFQNKTLLSEMASGAKNAGGKYKGANPTKYVAPFSQIPSSVAMKIVDYSPVGPVKEAIQQISAGSFDQRALSQAIGRGVTGTAIGAIGYALYNKGMMTLGYPSDQKTQEQWALEGKTANSILINGKWRQLASFGPAGDAMAVGGNTAAGMQGNKKTVGSSLNAGIQGLVGGTKVIADSPYLQGINNVTNAINDPVKNTVKLTEGLASSVIPTGVANIAVSGDPLQRQTNSISDAVQKNIPGLRENLLPKIDVAGQQIPRANDAIGTLLDPTYASTVRSSPFSNNLDALSKTGNDATPSAIPKNITQFGYTFPLTPEVQTQLQQKSGQAIASAFQSFFSNPSFTAADPATQKSILDNAASTIRSQVEKEYAQTLGKQGILDAGGKATASTGISAVSSSGSSSLKGKNIATGGIRLSGGREKGRSGKVTFHGSFNKAAKPVKQLKSLTVKNAGGTTKLAAPRSVVKRGKISSPFASNPVRRKLQRA